MTIVNTTEQYSLDRLSTEQLDELSVLDIYSSLLVEEAENIPGIVNKLSDEKLAAVVDLSSWDKDTFNPVNYTTWLKVLMSMEPFDAFREIKRMDRAELILFVSGVADIKWKEPEEAAPGNPFVTPDNTFLIYPKDNDQETEMFITAVSLINLAYTEDMAFGRSICVDVMSTAYSELEEECFRFKNARLSDEGVPAYLEAMELYHYEDPTKLLARIIKMIGDNAFKKHPPVKDYILSQHAVMPKSQWDSVMSISPELYDNVKIELGALLTASIVLNNALDMNPVNMSDTAKRSVSYFKIGLELIKEHYKGSIDELLKYVELKLIFRLGFSLLVDLKKNANNVKTALDALNRPDILSPDEQEFLKNLMLSIPMYQPSLELSPVQFDTLDQLKGARKLLSGIASRIVK